MDERTTGTTQLEQVQQRLDSLDLRLDEMSSMLSDLVHCFNEFRQEFRLDPRLNAHERREPGLARRVPVRRVAERREAPRVPDSASSAGVERPTEAPTAAAAPTPSMPAAGPRSPRDILASHPDGKGVHWDEVSETFQEGSSSADCLVYAEQGRYWMVPTSSYLDHPSLFHNRLARAFRWAEPKRGAILVLSPAEVTAVTGGRFQVVAQGEIAGAR